MERKGKIREVRGMLRSAFDMPVLAAPDDDAHLKMLPG
jgi:hypothetical protein